MPKLFSRGAKVFAKVVLVILLAVFVVGFSVPRIFAEQFTTGLPLDPTSGTASGTSGSGSSPSGQFYVAPTLNLPGSSLNQPTSNPTAPSFGQGSFSTNLPPDPSGGNVSGTGGSQSTGIGNSLRAPSGNFFNTNLPSDPSGGTANGTSGSQSTGASTADPNALNVPFYGHGTVSSFTEGGGQNTIQNFSVAVYKLIFWLAIPVAVVMIIIGGVMITFGGTSSEGASTGKDIIINALSALALLSLAGLFLRTILPWFYTAQ